MKLAPQERAAVREFAMRMCAPFWEPYWSALERIGVAARESTDRTRMRAREKHLRNLTTRYQRRYQIEQRNHL